MRKIRRLRLEALEACAFRGHTMSNFVTYHNSPDNRFAYCIDCGMRVDINAKPAANGIDIGGEAVALTCTGPAYKVHEDRYGGCTLAECATGREMYFQGDDAEYFLQQIGADYQHLVNVAPEYF